MESLASMISERDCIDNLDEEDVQYQIYRAIKARIKFLKEYIESLKKLLDERKLQEEYSEFGTRLAEDYILAAYYTDMAKDHLDDEEERLAKIVESNIRNLRRETGWPLDFFDTHRKNMLGLLHATDREYLAAKEAYDRAQTEQDNKKAVLHDFRVSESASLRANKAYIHSEIINAYEEIDELKLEKVEIIGNMDYIIYGDTKQDGDSNEGPKGVSKHIKPIRR